MRFMPNTRAKLNTETWLVFLVFYPQGESQYRTDNAPQWDEHPMEVEAISHHEAANVALNQIREERWLQEMREGEYRAHTVKKSNFSEWNIEKAYRAVQRLSDQE